MRSFLSLLLLALSSAPALCQSLVVAPSQTEDDRIRLLVGEPSGGPLTLTLRGFWRGDTDVLPLSKGSERHGARRVYHGDSPYFNAYEVQSVEVSRGPWRLCYAWTYADLYQGNADAAQTYLDSQAGTLTGTVGGYPRATMNRTAAIRWQAGYRTPLTLLRHRAELTLNASYLRMQRVQLGALAGATSGDQFAGVLQFLSTLDMPPDETRSDGLSLDAGLAVALDDRWRVAALCENLASRVWQRGLQSITADVATNTIVADGNGFLYGAPLLSGTIGRTNLRTELRRRFDLGAAYRQGHVDWMAFLRYDFDWRVAGGVTRDLGHGSRAWALLWADPFEWQAGIDWRCLRLALGMADIDASATERASVSLAIRIGLE